MKLNGLSGLCCLLAITFIFSACSSVKLVNIEKRRYMDGYYVNINHNKTKKKDLDQELLNLEEEAKYEAGKEVKAPRGEKNIVNKKVTTIKFSSFQ